MNISDFRTKVRTINDCCIGDCVEFFNGVEIVMGLIIVDSNKKLCFLDLINFEIVKIGMQENQISSEALVNVLNAELKITD